MAKGSGGWKNKRKKGKGKGERKGSLSKGFNNDGWAWGSKNKTSTGLLAVAL